MDDIQNLLKAATTEDALNDSNFDTFLKQYGFSEDDLTKRVLNDDLYLFYAFWHYSKYKTIPNRKNYTQGSNSLKRFA